MNEERKNKLLAALELASGVLERLGGFENANATERWEEMRRDVAAERWARHFRVSATANGYHLEPLTSEAKTLALFMDILEDIQDKTTSK